jgi:DNA-binding response OmpR family regulator
MKTNITIFLAEDDEDDAILFSDAISELLSDFDLTILCNGEKLMKHLETIQFLPDIIFLDLNMPVKNGFECLTEIKSHSSWKGIRTIILSTTSDDAQIKYCYSLGADMFLTKPHSYDKLKLYLKQCLFN